MCPFASILWSKIFYEKFCIRLNNLSLHVRTAFCFRKIHLPMRPLLPQRVGARQTMNLLREWQKALIFLFPEESKVCTPMSCNIDTHTHLTRYPYRAIFGLGILTPKQKQVFFAAHFLALTNSTFLESVPSPWTVIWMMHIQVEYWWDEPHTSDVEIRWTIFHF